MWLYCDIEVRQQSVNKFPSLNGFRIYERISFDSSVQLLQRGGIRIDVLARLLSTLFQFRGPNFDQRLRPECSGEILNEVSVVVIAGPHSDPIRIIVW